MSGFVSYKDHFLIAAPNMKDPVFSETVIYLCEHTEKGAMGVVINRGVSLSVASLLEHLGIENHNESLYEKMLFDGGPLQVERGFVLHSAGSRYLSSVEINEQITLSTSKDVLEALAEPQLSPEKFIICLGYAGWSDGQLEKELSLGGWLITPKDEAILFDLPSERRYEAALEQMGITSDDFNNWLNITGHA